MKKNKKAITEPQDSYTHQEQQAFDIPNPTMSYGSYNDAQTSVPEPDTSTFPQESFDSKQKKKSLPKKDPKTNNYIFPEPKTAKEHACQEIFKTEYKGRNFAWFMSIAFFILFYNIYGSIDDASFIVKVILSGITASILWIPVRLGVMLWVRASVIRTWREVKTHEYLYWKRYNDLTGQFPY